MCLVTNCIQCSLNLKSATVQQYIAHANFHIIRFLKCFLLHLKLDLHLNVNSVWTEEGVCVVLNSTVTADMNCSYNCGSECWRASKYPCLQVYVSVNNTGRVRRLSHNEESQDTSSEVSTGPDAPEGNSENTPITIKRSGAALAKYKKA